MTVRVVLADDHPMFRYGVQAVLAQAEGIDVVGVAADGAELLRAVEHHEPDVVLSDLSMPGMDGIAAMRSLLERHPGVAVVVLTMHDDDDRVRAALAAGATGYLLKGADSGEIARAIRAAADGQTVLTQSVARRVARTFVGGPGVERAPFPELTPRERDVLALLARGLRNSEIARQLGLTDKTVRNHVSAILLKLQVPDRTAAALRAQAAGLAVPDES